MKHLIIVKWNDKVKDKKEMISKVHEAFKEVTSIDGVDGVKIIESCSNKANRSDIIIKIDCSGLGLINYDASDLHKAWKENFSEYIASKAIFDFE